MAVFKPSLHIGVVDVGKDLQVFEFSFHALDPLLLVGFSSTVQLVTILLHQPLDLVSHGRNLLQFLLAVGNQNLPRFLEALVG